MIRSTSKVVLAALFTVGLLTAGGCSQTERYMATGAALGAGGGALIGAASGSTAGGAIVGGAVGAGVGYCVARDCLR